MGGLLHIWPPRRRATEAKLSPHSQPTVVGGWYHHRRGVQHRYLCNVFIGMSWDTFIGTFAISPRLICIQFFCSVWFAPKTYSGSLFGLTLIIFFVNPVLMSINYLHLYHMIIDLKVFLVVEHEVGKQKLDSVRIFENSA